ncbi:hypothetical protein DdX_17961 [Ditylenchus destructor]|uniref:Uncharacterized protein n=1 Tax=Ditylenchus destructor TaxID=166010 RepID=A0AAD4QT38_9BILA|nr:hypothetical protein DdX_17961 [Ditylenchus destructor]
MFRAGTNSKMLLVLHIIILAITLQISNVTAPLNQPAVKRPISKIDKSTAASPKQSATKSAMALPDYAKTKALPPLPPGSKAAQESTNPRPTAPVISRKKDDEKKVSEDSFQWL